MKSLKQAPSSTLRWWGLKSATAFDFVSGFLNDEGFRGPIKWSEGALVPYSKELSATIRTQVSVSAVTADNGYAVFDCGAVIYSKTIHDLARDADPEMAFRSNSIPGFAPCLAISLAHLKWCQQPSDINPSWAMSLENHTSRFDARAFTADFKLLMTPLLDALKSDDDLEALLVRSLSRSKPNWVTSDTPWFARLPAMVELLGADHRKIEPTTR